MVWIDTTTLNSKANQWNNHGLLAGERVVVDNDQLPFYNTDMEEEELPLFHLYNDDSDNPIFNI